MTMRIEKDMLGEVSIPAGVLHGVHTHRAVVNFPISGRPVSRDLVQAYALVKLACAMTNSQIGKIEPAKFAAIEQACHEMAEGKLNSHIVVDAFQGGAGTSTNMNVNEVLANRALLILGEKPGNYDVIHPIDTVNMHQSTNDTYPTALKVAAIFKLRAMEKSLVRLLDSFQNKEKQFAHIVKIGRTQMQDAVLTTLGKTMSAFAEAVARDRWRVFKCEERLRVVNLGGTAIGTGLGAPRQYIFKATENLRKITGIGLARAENLIEATQNNDPFVEVSGILNACASNLLKIAGDIRLLSSGPDAGIGEIALPKLQAGSSIMPGKVNPVIPEAVSQAALAAMSNNSAIAHAVALGSLELNPFLPLVAERLLETLTILSNAAQIFANLCIDGIKARDKRCQEHILSATATVTALIPEIGYENADKIASDAAASGKSVRSAAIGSGLLDAEKFDQLVSPEAVNRLGSK